MIERLCRLALIALGLTLLWSALAHWRVDAELERHYAAVGFPADGKVLVGIAQFVGGAFLLWPRAQPIAALVVALAMSAALVSHALHGWSLAALEPLALAVWAIVPAAWLWRYRRHSPPPR